MCLLFSIVFQVCFVTIYMQSYYRIKNIPATRIYKNQLSHVMYLYTAQSPLKIISYHKVQCTSILKNKSSTLLRSSEANRYSDKSFFENWLYGWTVKSVSAMVGIKVPQWKTFASITWPWHRNVFAWWFYY